MGSTRSGSRAAPMVTAPEKAAAQRRRRPDADGGPEERLSREERGLKLPMDVVIPSVLRVATCDRLYEIIEPGRYQSNKCL